MVSFLRATVIICTRGNGSRLPALCQALLSQGVDPGWFEILLVDNDCPPVGRAVVQRISRESGGRIRAIREPRVGLCSARNAGVSSSRGDILAFVDDDALPEPGWLQALLEGMDDPQVAAAGGPVLLLGLGARRPWWFDRDYLSFLSAWDLGTNRLALRDAELPRGTNMAFRSDVLRRLGGFDEALDRRGESLLSGGDLDVGLRLLATGKRVDFLPSARVGHLVSPTRLRLRWMLRRHFAQGRTAAHLRARHGNRAQTTARPHPRGLPHLRVWPGSLVKLVMTSTAWAGRAVGRLEVRWAAPSPTKAARAGDSSPGTTTRQA
jgi:GT2 family glycosyltransferase